MSVIGHDYYHIELFVGVYDVFPVDFFILTVTVNEQPLVTEVYCNFTGEAFKLLYAS